MSNVSKNIIKFIRFLENIVSFRVAEIERSIREAISLPVLVSDLTASCSAESIELLIYLIACDDSPCSGDALLLKRVSERRGVVKRDKL